MTNEQQRAFVAALLAEVRAGDLTQRQAARVLATFCLVLTDAQPYCWRQIGEMPPPSIGEPAAQGVMTP